MGHHLVVKLEINQLSSNPGMMATKGSELSFAQVHLKRGPCSIAKLVQITPHSQMLFSIYVWTMVIVIVVSTVNHQNSTATYNWFLISLYKPP